MGKTFFRLRCPSCGKMSPAKNFAAGSEGKHVLEVAAISKKPDSKSGFAWDKRPVTREEREQLRETTLSVLAHLEDSLDRDELREAPTETEFHRRAERYLADGQRLLQEAEAELDYRRREVATLTKRWAQP